MNDISETVIPKSDQLNSDDLISGPITIRITKVTINPSAPDQPVSLYFEGDNNKPYKPCKSMRRVLINTWGAKSSEYVGRSMSLYRDATVKFGGFEVGGTRISHMSNIEKPITMALTATRASRKPFTVQPLKQQQATSAQMFEPDFLNTKTLELARKAARGGTDDFTIWWKSASQDERRDANTIKVELTGLRKIADDDQAARALADTSDLDSFEFGVPDACEAGMKAKADGLSLEDMPAHIKQFPELNDAFVAGFNADAEA
jgi:hypothetical protein